jgi:hypothetical protein
MIYYTIHLLHNHILWFDYIIIISQCDISMAGLEKDSGQAGKYEAQKER